jgi:diguanylate cyclase (GGDEF)-like protein
MQEWAMNTTAPAELNPGPGLAPAPPRPRQFWHESLEASRCPALLRDCLMALIDATPGMVMVSSSKGRLLYMNGVGRRLLGMDPHASIVARTVFDIYSPNSCDLLLGEAVPTCLRSGMWRGEMTLVDSAGAEIPVSQVLMAHHVREQDGKETSTLSSIAWDIREMKAIEQQLRHQATHDALTGLPNRMLLLDRLEQAIAMSERKGSFVGVLFIDLDGFKSVNDTHGHEAANQLLCALGQRLAGRVRGEDTIARYGGDEFVLVIPELASPEDIGRVMNQVRGAVYEPFVVGGKTVRLEASIGVAIYPQDGRDAGALLRRADGRMYEQKPQPKAGGPGPSVAPPEPVGALAPEADPPAAA